MDVLVYNTSFILVTIIDAYESFIWTDRYNSCGDFELVVPMDDVVLNDIQMGYYIKCELSDRTMIIESIELDTDTEKGTFATFSGRSLESILDRRVVWGYFNYIGSMQTGIQQLLTKNIISPTDSKRRISNFMYSTSSITDITEIEYEFALLGENLLDVVQECCQANDVGFKVILNNSNQFVFSLYVGNNMSFSQSILPWVVFSPAFDNLLSSKYYCSEVTKKTVSMVAGEGEVASERKIVEATIDIGSSTASSATIRRWGYDADSSGTYTGGTGLDRKEIFTNASDVSQTYRDENDQEHTLTDAEYEEQLKSKGQEALGEYYTTQTFEGDTDYEGQFVYGRDYAIGDILQIENEYGISAAVRVMEVVNTIDESGQSVVPGFTAV